MGFKAGLTVTVGQFFISESTATLWCRLGHNKKTAALLTY
jgi:hypothetical protein